MVMLHSSVLTMETTFDKTASSQGPLTCLFWSFKPYHTVSISRLSLISYHGIVGTCDVVKTPKTIK